MCENVYFLFPVHSLITLTCKQWLSYKWTVHVWFARVFRLPFSGISACILGFTWMSQCQASFIQHEHFAWFEVNRQKTVLEISKKGPGKSLPGFFAWKSVRTLMNITILVFPIFLDQLQEKPINRKMNTMWSMRVVLKIRMCISPES